MVSELLKGKTYKQIIYVGDGDNDYCPLRHLGKNDWVMARKDYMLETEILNKGVECNVLYWRNGREIQE